MNKPIEVTSHVARDFLQNSAYFNTVPKVTWEYVSNSIDNPQPNKTAYVEVYISKERIVIADNGCGMTREGLNNFFQMHAKNIRRSHGESVRGRYGTGKCAAFGIADVLHIESAHGGVLNIVELSREDIEQYNSGEPFPVKDIVVEKPTVQEDGTRIIISKLNIKNIEVQATIAYIERHLGRLLNKHTVLINDHTCEYQEPVFINQIHFHPNPEIAHLIGNLDLVINVSPIPLEKERSGIDILSNGIWHDTTTGTIDLDIIRKLFGDVDIPILEDRYDLENIPPFDNTRNMTLNKSNPLVVTLLGWIDECLHEVAIDLIKKEKENKACEEAKRLVKQAQKLEMIFNRDFRGLQIQLDKIRRQSKIKSDNITEELVPDEGNEPTLFSLGGPEYGDGIKGEKPGLGDEEKSGNTLLPGEEKGSLNKVSTQKVKQSTFHVEYLHEGQSQARSRYDRDSRTIVINLDHPQIFRALRNNGGIEGREFKEMTFEVAGVEYAIALGYEKELLDPFYSGAEALFDIRDTINRVSKIDEAI